MTVEEGGGGSIRKKERTKRISGSLFLLWTAGFLGSSTVDALWCPCPSKIILLPDRRRKFLRRGFITLKPNSKVYIQTF